MEAQTLCVARKTSQMAVLDSICPKHVRCILNLFFVIKFCATVVQLHTSPLQVGAD